MDQRTALLDELQIDRTEVPRRPTGGRRRAWLIGIGTVVFATAIGVALRLSGPESVPVRAVIARGVTATGGSRAVESLLEASGYVIALREATVSGKSIYKVEEILVQEGQPVKQGQVIARLDDSNARAALDQTKAQVKQFAAALAAAKVAADDARPIFLRNQRQRAEGLISEDTFDASKATYDATQTAVAVARENLAVAEANVVVNQRFEDDTLVKAPFAGVVTSTTAQPGELVSPQFSGGGGIAKIVDMDSLEVDVDVSENFINRVHPEQPATITLNAYPGRRIPAVVIAIIPTADRSKATVKVRVGIKEKDSRIVPEMGAQVSFLETTSDLPFAAASPAPSVVVPTEAVLRSGDAGIVFVINGDRIERQTVRLGARTVGGQTILAGLQPGSKLAVGDFGKLRDGSRVRIEP